MIYFQAPNNTVSTPAMQKATDGKIIIPMRGPGKNNSDSVTLRNPSYNSHSFPKKCKMSKCNSQQHEIEK